ncbi:MAG: CusA/CzcA family heavy metal efflux RND transporter [Bacteroidetes bacterium]|nr:CusA/CzcA family heavy metal efflux RND transporter [Bacteroidota bacterium]
MLDKIIYFSIHNKFIVGVLTLAMFIYGLYSLKTLPIDALPDITNNQVQILTTAPTLASQEVEQLITYPIEQSVKTIPQVIELRSISRFGLSVVTVVFKEEADIYWAREQIFQRIKEAEEIIPKYVGSPSLAPITTGLGEIYQYDVFAMPGYETKYNATELRTIQDWIIVPQLQGVKGVAEVSTWGGSAKQFEIAVDPNKLNSMSTTTTEIFDAVEKNNQNTGGAYIEKDNLAYIIRGVGMANGIQDIENIVVKNRNGAPILVRDVATVQEGTAIKYGAVTKDGKGEIVGGLALMLKGENSSEVVKAVKERMLQINKSLPEGVKAEAFIDRSKLVDNAISTVTKNLIEGALIVIFVLVLFLGNLRAGLIVASVIPLAMLFAIIMMNLFGISGNLMSLGAIDFGIIVDGAVIIVEATMHHLFKLNKSQKLTQDEMDKEVFLSASKIRSSAAFGEMIILIVYLPILVLVGIEGKMFTPMAKTVGFAIIGAFILSLTYVPMLSSLFLSKKTKHTENFSDKMMRFFENLYTPFLQKSLQMKSIVLSVTLLLFVLAIMVYNSLGGEFMPKLDEGDLAINSSIMTGSSLSQMIKTTTQYEKLIKAKFPEVKNIVSKIGSGEIPTDPMPIESGDLIITLHDKKDWKNDETTEEIGERIKTEMMKIPGANIEVSQPIQMRFNELMTGSRSDVAIKIFGDDLDILSSKADALIKSIQSIEGIADIKAEKISGLPQITITYDYAKIALYGLNVEELNKIVRSSFAGESAGKLYEGSKRFDIVVRIQKDLRTDIADVSNLYIPLPDGNQVPLSQVANVSYELGPVQVSREDGKRRIVIGLNVRGRDVKSVVEEIQARVSQGFKLPAGYYITYGGTFKNLQEANQRLSIAVPIALVLIFILLFFTFYSMSQAVLIFVAIPLSAIGGVFALWLRGMPFSISAGIGFIALFGVAVLNGIVLIAYFNQLQKEGVLDPVQRVIEGTKTRLRPVLMTGFVASLGFLPMALSNGSGAEVQKPLATVVIGGLISATFLTLIVLPILYLLFEKRFKKSNQKIIKSASLLVSILMISNLSYAQQSISLKEAISLAKQNNSGLMIHQLEVEKQAALKKSAFDPEPMQIQYQGGQFNTPAFDHNVSVQQYFPLGKLTKANKALQDELMQLANQQNTLQAFELEKAITLTYYQFLYGDLLISLHKELDSVYENFFKNAQLRFTTGESGNIEVLSAKAKKNEISLMLSQLQSDMIMYTLQFNYFLQNPIELIPDTKTELKFTTSEKDTAQYLNLIKALHLRQNEIIKKENGILFAKKQPRLGVGYFMQSIDKQFYYQGFTAGMQIPILNKSIQARIQANEISIKQSNKLLEQNQWQLNNLREQQKVIKYKNENVLNYFENEGLQYANEIISTAQKSFSNGDITYWNYINFLNQAIDIKKQYVEAIHTYNKSAIDLQYQSLK